MRALNPSGHTFYPFFYLRPNPEQGLPFPAFFVK
jgi:hypothetical protein